MNVDEPLRVIKAKCLDCSGGCARLAEQCEVKECPLYAYRPAAPKRGKKKEKQISIFELEEIK